MRTDKQIDDRYRYVLSRSGLRMHKNVDDHGRRWYYVYDANTNQSSPPDDSDEWMNESKFISFIEELEQQKPEEL